MKIYSLDSVFMWDLPLFVSFHTQRAQTKAKTWIDHMQHNIRSDIDANSSILRFSIGNWASAVRARDKKINEIEKLSSLSSPFARQFWVGFSVRQEYSHVTCYTHHTPFSGHNLIFKFSFSQFSPFEVQALTISVGSKCHLCQLFIHCSLFLSPAPFVSANSKQFSVERDPFAFALHGIDLVGVYFDWMRVSSCRSFN